MKRVIGRAGWVRWFLVVGLLGTFSSWVLPLAAEPLPSEREVSLAELLAFAERHAPAPQLRERYRAYGKAAQGAADSMRYNPTLELALGPRFEGAGEREIDVAASLTQPVEVGGQGRLRRNAADRWAERLDAEVAAARWELRRDVTLAFHAAVVARARGALAQRLLGFADEMVRIAERRLAAGDASIIELRVAQADAAEARQALLTAEQELSSVRLQLAEVTGGSLEQPPQVPAELAPPHALPALSGILQKALERHPELRARRAFSAESHARVELVEREAWPTPAFGVQWVREGVPNGAANHIVQGTLELPLPLWQTNSAARAESRVAEDIARAEQKATERALTARIVRAHLELSAAAERARSLRSGVAQSLADSLVLLQRGFDAGEISWLEVTLARERFVRAEGEALNAYADYQRALAELSYASGTELSNVTGVEAARPALTPAVTAPALTPAVTAPGAAP